MQIFVLLSTHTWLLIGENKVTTRNKVLGWTVITVTILVVAGMAAYFSYSTGRILGWIYLSSILLAMWMLFMIYAKRPLRDTKTTLALLSILFNLVSIAILYYKDLETAAGGGAANPHALEFMMIIIPGVFLSLSVNILATSFTES